MDTRRCNTNKKPTLYQFLTNKHHKNNANTIRQQFEWIQHEDGTTDLQRMQYLCNLNARLVLVQNRYNTSTVPTHYYIRWIQYLCNRDTTLLQYQNTKTRPTPYEHDTDALRIHEQNKTYIMLIQHDYKTTYTPSTRHIQHERNMHTIRIHYEHTTNATHNTTTRLYNT